MTTRTKESSTRGTAGASSTDTASQEHPLAGAAQEAGDSAGELATRAADIGFRQADTRREQTAEGLQSLASGIRRVSGDLETEQPQIAGVIDTAAEQTDRLARYLRETDTRQMVSNVEDLARRQPILFLGGAFLLGVAVSRFVKAAGGGNSQQQRSFGDTSPYGYSGSYQVGGATGGAEGL